MEEPCKDCVYCSFYEDNRIVCDNPVALGYALDGYRCFVARGKGDYGQNAYKDTIDRVRPVDKH